MRDYVKILRFLIGAIRGGLGDDVIWIELGKVDLRLGVLDGFKVVYFGSEFVGFDSKVYFDFVGKLCVTIRYGNPYCGRLRTWEFDLGDPGCLDRVVGFVCGSYFRAKKKYR